MSKPPPLKALRVFDVAARHPNFTSAARELCVTHGAVSRQIALLQDHVGLPLFERRGRAMVLTDAGAILAKHTGDAFQHLRQAVAALSASHPAGIRSFVVSTLPSFAKLWLLPRLPGFLELHPGVRVELRTTQLVDDLDRSGIDLAIRYGRGRWPGVTATPLFRESIFPVCSPEFVRAKPMAAPKDLLGAALIHDASEPWAGWFRQFGLKAKWPLTGLVFDDSGLVIDAAVKGQGVALARSLLVADQMESGKLVRLFRARKMAPYRYFAAWKRDKVLSPIVISFIKWLEAQNPGRTS